MDGGKRGPGDVVWSWGDLCFDHSMIHLSAYMMVWGGGEGSEVMVGWFYLCFYISMIHLSACNMDWRGGVG